MVEKTIINVTRTHIPERYSQLFGKCSEFILWKGLGFFSAGLPEGVFPGYVESWARFLKVPISLRTRKA